MNRMLKHIAINCIVFGLLMMIVNPVSSAPLTGAQGSRIQANFMNQDPDPADAERTSI